MVGWSPETGDLRYQFNSDFGAAAELITANSDGDGPFTEAVVANTIEALNVTAAFTLIAAADYVGITFERVGTSALDTITTWFIAGFLLEYNI